jgi:IS4 transposase
LTKGGEVDPMASSDEVEHLRGENEDLTNLLASLNYLVVEELERKGAEIVNRRVLRNTLTEDQVVHNVKNNLAKLIEVQGIEQAKSSRDHHNVVTGMNSVIDAQVAEIDALKTEVAEIDALKTELEYNLAKLTEVQGTEQAKSSRDHHNVVTGMNSVIDAQVAEIDALKTEVAEIDALKIELELTKLKLKTSETMEADLGALISGNNARENTAAGKKDCEGRTYGNERNSDERKGNGYLISS